jgi:hypothetical protein
MIVSLTPFAFAQNARGSGEIIVKVIDLQLNQNHLIDRWALLSSFLFLPMVKFINGALTFCALTH